MLIVDGKTHRIDSISLMNPQDFESVEVLKSAAATALFGAEGVNGVIWITTKNSGFRKLIIKDSLDGSPIAGATVLFTSLKDRHEKLQIIANDSGVVITNKLNGPARYRMTVSAVGYITTEQFFESNAGKGKEIFLNRDVVSCGEVILSYISCPRRPINNWFICKVSGINITAAAEKEEQSVASPLEFKVYPNPVQRSGSLNLRFDNAEGKQKIVRVISLDGRILLQQSFTTSWGKNLFQLPTDARWSAGIYFVQLLYENGQVAASEKVIIR
jgi:TonB-dependent SusC/RagA subfamily outer membrane receptor